MRSAVAAGHGLAGRCAATCGWLRRRLGGSERGSAVVEFLGVALLLLIPVVYLVVTLAQIQSAAFAAEGAAREAGRLIAQADTFEAGVASAQIAVELSFADQGLNVSGADALSVQCQADPCLSPGAYVHVAVSSDVPLPATPAFLSDVLPAATHVEGTAMTAIPRYREAGE